MHASARPPAALARHARVPHPRLSPRLTGHVDQARPGPEQQCTPCRAVRDAGEWPTSGAAAGAAAPAPTPLEQSTPNNNKNNKNNTAAARAAAQRAAAQVDQVMAEIGRELFVGRAIGTLMQDAPDDDDDDSDSESASPPTTNEATIISRVVAARLEGMDEAFLAALGVAADSAAEAGDAAAAGRLAAVRAEVLAQAGARLTPALRVLDAATRAGDAAGRRAVIAAAGSGTNNTPAAKPAPIFSAASQLIDDMEAASVVPDAALLARLCLAREDVLDGGAGSASRVLATAAAAHATMLHAGGAELAGTLASNPSPAAERARRALIARACFVDGAWEAMAATCAGGTIDMGTVPEPSPPPSPTSGLSPAAAAAAAEAAARRAPRPGRTLTALRALRDEMTKRGQPAQAAGLETARRDVLAVLEGVAYGRAVPVVAPAEVVSEVVKAQSGVLPLASAKAPSAVHGVAWLPAPAAAGAHVVAVGGTPVGAGWAQLYTLAGTTNLRLDASAPDSMTPSTLSCCCVVGDGGGGPAPPTAIIAGGADGRLRAWALDGGGGLVDSASTSTSASALACHPGGVQALATPGGPGNVCFASAGSDGSVAVWDGRASLAGRPASRLGGGGASGGEATPPAGPAWAVALSPGDESGGSVLVAGHATGTIRTWCLRTGRVRWAGRLPGSPGVCGLGLGPHAADAGGPGTYFAAGTGGLVAAVEAGTAHPVEGLAATAARLGGDGHSPSTQPPPTVWTALPLPGSRGLVGCACGDGRLRLLRHRRAAGSARVASPADGRPAGVPGALTSLATMKLADQALTCLAWCGGHAGLFAAGGMDEAVRVGVVPRAGLV